MKSKLDFKCDCSCVDCYCYLICTLRSFAGFVSETNRKRIRPEMSPLVHMSHLYPPTFRIFICCLKSYALLLCSNMAYTWAPLFLLFLLRWLIGDVA
jgi:hypothetical protein